MSFVFEIIDVYDIKKDPIGHQHHWTILIGKMSSGMIAQDDKIEVPYSDGIPMVTRVAQVNQLKDDAVFRKTNDPDGQYWDCLEVFTSAPAISGARALRTQVRPCSDEYYEAALLNILRSDPSRFFHTLTAVLINTVDERQELEIPCQDCMRAARRLSGSRPILEELTQHSDEKIASMVTHLLNPPPRPQKAPKPKAPWWAFWRNDR